MIKTFLRKWRLRLGKLLLDRPRRIFDLAKDPKNIKKILYIRYNGKIGDYIVSSFVFRELKKTRPDIEIHVLASASNTRLYQNNPFIDKVYILKNNRSYPEFISLGKILNQEKYDTLLDANIGQKNRNFLLIRLINAKWNVGYLKDNYQLYDLNISYQKQHLRVINQQMLAKIGIPIANLHYDIPEDQKSEENIETFFKEKNIKNPISLNFFGDHFTKQFTQDHALKLLKIIQNKLPNQQIIILIYPQVKELVKFWLKNINCQAIFIYEKTEKIEDSIAIIKRCQGLITPDTSLVHIGSGLGKKI